LEFSIPLNKFEKEKKVIELHKLGKTIREIAPIVHMSFTDISKIRNEYEKKLRLQQNKKENNQQPTITKKSSLSSRAFQLFSDGKKPVQVAIDLNIDYLKVRKYWTEFLRMNKMKKLYNIYIKNEHHLDSLFRIYYFMRKNEISIQYMEDVLGKANDVINLNQIISNLKTEIDGLNQMKNTYSLNQHNNYKQMLPLGLPGHYYR
jgi:hypothetical protein